jgi:Nucleoside diphosphate kinase
MGATNPNDAAEGTIRRDYAESLGEKYSPWLSTVLKTRLLKFAYFFSQTERVNSAS